MTHRIGYKRFTFYDNDQVEVITDKDYRRHTVDVTPATYNRFASLANSGQFHFHIMTVDNGVAWEVYRLA